MTHFSKNTETKNFAWGGKAFLLPFSSKDVVSIEGSVLGGKRYGTRPEIAQTLAAMLTEGTKRRTKKQIQEFLDSIGASVSFTAGQDRLEFTAHSRAARIDEVLKLIAEMLAEPTIPQKELALLKKRALGNLVLAAQNTRTQAEIRLSRLLYAPGHPNRGRTTEEEKASLLKLDRGELSAFHKRIIGGNSLIIAASGDIEPAKLFKSIDTHFKKLPRRNAGTLPASKITANEPLQAAVHITGKSNIDYMAGVRTGLRHTDEDYLPLMLGVHILGHTGGFTGRLMRTVREKEGLTYLAYSYLSGFDDRMDGHVMAWGTFAPQLFEKGRAGFLREIISIAKEGVTEEELRSQAHMYAARMHVRLSNTRALAAALHDTVAEGRELSYLDELPEKVRALSREQVNAALKKYLQPERIAEAVAGPVDAKMLGKL